MSSQGSKSSKIVHQPRPFIFFEPIDCASFAGAPDISFRQYNSGAVGGVAVGYPDGTSSLWHVNDQNGTSLNQASAGSTWLNRCADISMGGAEQVAPSSLSVVVDSTTGAGSWSIYYGDMSITSTNGTVTQINLGAASQVAVQGAGISGAPTANWETVSETNDPTSAQIAATHYLATDHLGSSQMEFSQGGWPVASKQFGPYGAELNAQSTLDHYKFTGKERDAESGLDYFGARYMSSNMGRFTSPDWAAKAEPVPYAKLADPQTLNLYAYAGNNPMSNRDADGHLYGDASGSPSLPDECPDPEACGHNPAIKTFDQISNENWARSIAMADQKAQKQQLTYWQSTYVLIPHVLGPSGLADQEIYYTVARADGHPVDQQFYVSEVLYPKGKDTDLTTMPNACGQRQCGTDRSNEKNAYDDTIGQGLQGPFKRDQYFIISTESKVAPEHYSRIPVRVGNTDYWSQEIIDDRNRNVTFIRNPEMR